MHLRTLMNDVQLCSDRVGRHTHTNIMDNHKQSIRFVYNRTLMNDVQLCSDRVGRYTHTNIMGNHMQSISSYAINKVHMQSIKFVHIHALMNDVQFVTQCTCARVL